MLREILMYKDWQLHTTLKKLTMLLLFTRLSCLGEHIKLSVLRLISPESCRLTTLSDY